MRYHHLDSHAFLGKGGIHPGHQPLGPYPQPHAGAPLHILMQHVRVPMRCDPADFDEGDKLNPLDADMLLQLGPVIKGIPVGDQAQFGGIIDRGLVVETLRVVANFCVCQLLDGYFSFGRFSSQPILCTFSGFSARVYAGL
jgi:hypothetical protein